MKTLQEVLDRQDYVRVTEELKYACVKIAEKIRIKMRELDVKSTHGYSIERVKSRSCGYSEMYLAYCDGYEFYDLETTDSGYYYYCNDFNCKVLCATNKMRLDFLKVANDILQTLDEIETEQVREIEEVLSKQK